MRERFELSISEDTATIRLKGEPYHRVVDGEEVDCTDTLNSLTKSSGYRSRLPFLVSEIDECLDPLFRNGGFYGIDGKLKHGEPLSFSEAFSLMTYVCAALNRPLFETISGRVQNLGSPETHLLQATALLSAVSCKESYVGLTPQEIAGMVAAAIQLDTVVRTKCPDRIFGFGGMGGDKGYPLNGTKSKLFSLSTLTAVALSADGYLVHKHHSYPNTSKVAGQSAIEAFGARSDFNSPEAFDKVLTETGLLMTSCHNTRTLHTLSHLLRGETVNHVVGPLSFTVDKRTTVDAMVGVNEKIHPEVICEALLLLNDFGFQDFGNSAAFFGTDFTAGVPAQMFNPADYNASSKLKEHVTIDEIAPPPYVTMVSFLSRGSVLGTYVLYPSDFYNEEDLKRFNFNSLLIPNEKEAILEANAQALSGVDISKAKYLAMTIGFSIFVRQYLEKVNSLDLDSHRVNPEYLRECTHEALELLLSGRALDQLHHYVSVTKKYAGRNV